MVKKKVEPKEEPKKVKKIVIREVEVDEEGDIQLSKYKHIKEK